MAMALVLCQEGGEAPLVYMGEYKWHSDHTRKVRWLSPRFRDGM